MAFGHVQIVVDNFFSFFIVPRPLIFIGHIASEKSQPSSSSSNPVTVAVKTATSKRKLIFQKEECYESLLP